MLSFSARKLIQIYMGAVTQVVNLDVPGPSIMYKILLFIAYVVQNHKCCLFSEEPASERSIPLVS